MWPRSHKADKACPKGCHGPTLAVRSAEEYGIPTTIWAGKGTDDNAFHCFHCQLVWFQGDTPHARLMGHYRGGQVFEPMEEMVVYVKDKRTVKRPMVPPKRNYKRIR